jgi:ribosomal protein L32
MPETVVCPGCGRRILPERLRPNGRCDGCTNNYRVLY